MDYKKQQYNKNYYSKNKEKQKYINYKCKAKYFINKLANIEDIKELKNLIEEKTKNVK